MLVVKEEQRVEFGRFADPGRADTRLPPDPPETGALLRSRQGSARGTTVRIGAARWGVQEWVGSLYPRGTPPAEYLRHYALRFAAVELNTTFYRMPQEEELRRWGSLVPASFRFCPTRPRAVSQRRHLAEELGSTTEFARRVESLGERLGLCFLQLPPHFGPAGVTELRQYLLAVPRELPLAVEFRHPGWFRDPLARETFAFLAGHGMATVITDTLGRRDAVHMRLSTRRAFVRFVGNDLHPSDYRRIDDWVSRLDAWAGLGLEEVYFFVHEPREAHTLALVSYLEEKLGERSLTSRGG
jgi:uncharacterized protein YecE (DUF72 family)